MSNYNYNYTYEVYYVVKGVPFTMLLDSYKSVLNHCELLEKDELTDKYEVRQIIKKYERENIESRPEQDNNSSSKQQNLRTCKNNACGHKQICRQLSIIDI